MLTGRSSAECCVSCCVSFEDLPRVSGFLYGLVCALVQFGIAWCSASRGTLGDSIGRNLTRKLGDCCRSRLLCETLVSMRVGAVDKR